MPRVYNQKQRMFALYRLLYEQTDEKHALAMGEILDRLADMDIPADRRSIYSDIEILNEQFAENPRNKYNFHIIIERTKTNPIRYYLKSREFELFELKLLMDSVRTFKYITKAQTTRLIKRLEKLCSNHQLNELRARSYIVDFEKSKEVRRTGQYKNWKQASEGYGNRRSLNDDVFSNLDILNEAIKENKCISFRYHQYIVSKKMNEGDTINLRHSGKRHDWISPFALVYTDGYYYLLG